MLQCRALQRRLTVTKCLVLGIAFCIGICVILSSYPIYEVSRCSCETYHKNASRIASRQPQVHSQTGQPQVHSQTGQPQVHSQKGTEDGNISWGKHKLALIVPFRDRFEELLEFAPYMHEYLNKQKVRHSFYIINQVDNFRFNRASLINIGFLESKNDCDYIAMHDVDLLPVNPNLTYHYPDIGPLHIASPELHPSYHYEKFVGGILLLKRDDFVIVNGMSNRYWGWGREDDEFYVRMKRAGFKIERPQNITTGYKTFRHIHDRKRRPRDSKPYFDQRKKTSRLDRETGISNVRYSIESRREIIIDGAAVTVVNVVLDCDVKSTPWCLKPEDQIKYKEQGLI